MADKKPQNRRKRPKGPIGEDGQPKTLSLKTQNGVVKARAVANQKIALEMRIEGRTYREIAKALGYANAGGAMKACDAAMRNVIKEPADTLRKIQLERLDAMLSALWPAIREPEKCESVGPPPDPEEKNYEAKRTAWEFARIKAMETILKIETRRSKLEGTDAPVKTETSGPKGGPIEINTTTYRPEELTDDELRRHASM